MADKNINQVNGGQTTSPTNGRFYVIRPAATPSGFEDYWISESDLHSALNTLISSNTSNISNHETRITQVESSVLKTVVQNTGTFDFNMPINSSIDSICIKTRTGNPIVSIVNATSGDVYLSEYDIESDGYLRLTLNTEPFKNVSNIQVTVIGGYIDITRFTKTNIFS